MRLQFSADWRGSSLSQAPVEQLHCIFLLELNVARVRKGVEHYLAECPLEVEWFEFVA